MLPSHKSIGTVMEQTKITMKICKPLLHKFNQQIDSVFIKRDALINHILKVEVKHLGKELQGLVLSSKARQVEKENTS